MLDAAARQRRRGARRGSARLRLAPHPELLRIGRDRGASVDIGAELRVARSASFVLKGGSVFGVGKQNLLIDSGRVIALGVSPNASDRIVDVTGRYIVPGFIDSHVRLAYDPVGRRPAHEWDRRGARPPGRRSSTLKAKPRRAPRPQFRAR